MIKNGHLPRTKALFCAREVTLMQAAFCCMYSKLLYAWGPAKKTGNEKSRLNSVTGGSGNKSCYSTHEPVDSNVKSLQIASKLALYKAILWNRSSLCVSSIAVRLLPVYANQGILRQ